MKKIIFGLWFWRRHLKNEFFPPCRWHRGKQLKRGEISGAHFIRCLRTALTQQAVGEFGPEGGE